MEQFDSSAISRISPRVRVRDSVSIVYRIAPGGYSWIFNLLPRSDYQFSRGFQSDRRSDCTIIVKLIISKPICSTEKKTLFTIF